jgi:hypothetical protein
MKLKPLAVWVAGAGLAGALAVAADAAAGKRRTDVIYFRNDSGVQATFSTTGFDPDNPFFQDLGTNGRSCFTCHRPEQAWSIAPEELEKRFAQTSGLEGIFRSNDGSTCEGADISTIGRRRSAFRLLVDKGLIRVGLTVPADAEFEIVDVDDPYRCGRPFSETSLFRRPLPSANLTFLSAVMWDGRETVNGHAVRADLLTQAMDATMGHAAGNPPTSAQLQAIVDFETGLYTGQVRDHGAGNLDAHGGHGGPATLLKQPFCIGINDPLSMLPAMPGACATPSGGLDPNVFTLFGSWEHGGSPHRQAIARGERIFNTRTFVIDNVGGLNGRPGDPVAGPITSGTCTVCHNTPNAGNHSVAMALDLGLTDAANRTLDLPLYTLQHKTTHETVQSSDPGRAMITGRWNDIGKFKGPVLRGLASRAPYFHNGSAATLADAVDFYDRRFHINLTKREKADLVAFLRAL